MKRPLVILGAALLGAACLPTLAQQKPEAKSAAMVASAPGTGTITSAVSISARVEAIDKAQRQLTLKGPKGNVQTVTAGPDVRNFDQIQVGDMVVARYVESLTLTLKKDGKELRGKTEKEDSARAKAGEKPAGIVGRQVEVTADVIKADAKTQTLTLKGPNQTVELKVPDPAQFKLVKVGDQIQAVYTEAVALSVESAAPAKK
jgi:Cu/Ag efflux protein CusF